MVDAVHGAYGAPVLAALTGAAPKAKGKAKGQAKAGARKHPAASTAGN
jgi:hypothetical protein